MKHISNFEVFLNEGYATYADIKKGEHLQLPDSKNPGEAEQALLILHTLSQKAKIDGNQEAHKWLKGLEDANYASFQAMYGEKFANDYEKAVEKIVQINKAYAEGQMGFWKQKAKEYTDNDDYEGLLKWLRGKAKGEEREEAERFGQNIWGEFVDFLMEDPKFDKLISDTAKK
jgi:hypothetical protein